VTIFSWIASSLGRRSRGAALAAVAVLVGGARVFLGWDARYVLVFAVLGIGVVFLLVMQRDMPLRGLRGRPGEDDASRRRFLAENWSVLDEAAQRKGVPPEKIAELRGQIFGPGRDAD
jgi:O-antigen ligase